MLQPLQAIVEPDITHTALHERVSADHGRRRREGVGSGGVSAQHMLHVPARLRPGDDGSRGGLRVQLDSVSGQQAVLAIDGIPSTANVYPVCTAVLAAVPPEKFSVPRCLV